MADWPISISEAARRLDIPRNVANVLVRAFHIPTVSAPLNGKAKCLERAAFEKLRKAAQPWKGSRQRETVATP